MIEIDNNSKLHHIEEVKTELVRQSVVAQRLKDAQYSEENLSTVEKIYKYAANHMGIIGFASENEETIKDIDNRLNNELCNPDKESGFESSKEVLPLYLNTCINNCDIVKEQLKK